MAYVIDRMFYINNVLGCIMMCIYITVIECLYIYISKLHMPCWWYVVVSLSTWYIGIYLPMGYWNIYIYILYVYIYIYIGILMKNVFIYPNIPLMGGSINGDTQNSWCVMEISNRKWMMARGTPILGNLHSDIMFHISHWYPRNMIFDFTV